MFPIRKHARLQLLLMLTAVFGANVTARAAVTFCVTPTGVGLSATGANLDSALAYLSGSGDDNLIQGNLIGGYLTGNNDGVRVTGSAGTTSIGGSEGPETRNLILYNSDVGVYIDSTTGGNSVFGNLIGVASDGCSPAPNGDGIYVYGSPSNTIVLNTVSNSTNAGVTLSGAAAALNVVQYNKIGVAETCTGSSSNGTEGILVSAGAHDNTIGAKMDSAYPYGGNTLFSANTGVWISPFAGAGNSVIANNITAIAGLGIDLGTLGPTDNHSGGNSGPNGLQNFPVILHAYRTQTAEWIEGYIDSYSDILNPPIFRLDFYYAASDSGPQGRGAPEFYVGESAADNPYTDVNGHAHFWVRLPLWPLTNPLGLWSATATDPNGNTSEIEPYVQESNDMIFRDDFKAH